LGIDAQLRPLVSGGWSDRRFLALTGAAVPIVQAPMAGAGDTALCIAAITGGAVGSLPCGMLSPAEVREQVAAVRAAPAGPLNLNFFCHTMPEAPDDTAWRALLAPYHAEFGVAPGNGGALRLPFDGAMCAAVEEVRPEVVSFHFGLPAPALLERVRAAGAAILGNATTPEEARWLEARGADAIIAQGFEAGGHTGRFLGDAQEEALGLFALLPQIVDAVSVPVVAAGGIADGRGIAAAFALGASAVQIGTAYLSCPESRISDAHRAALAKGGTVFTNLLTGGLARGARGRLMRELGPVRPEAPPYPLAAAALTPIRRAAEAKGEFGFGPMWAGQAGPLARAMPAAVLTRTLAEEALAVLARLA
jgi:nitronate monooxygenase